MFQTKTLFVVGAGASSEVALPMGDRLKAIISDKLDFEFQYQTRQISGDPELADLIRRRWYSDPTEAKEHFIASSKIAAAMPQALSIDNYLEAHEDDPRIGFCGKLAITQAIIEAERTSLLYTLDDQKLDFKECEKTWLGQFVKLLTEGVSRTKLDTLFDNVSFIVFNYDRCVEHYLYHALQNYYSISRGETVRIMRRLRIVHPYGRVGKLPWEDPSDAIQFGAQSCDLVEASKQIKTYTERIDDRSAMIQLENLVQEASKVVFLGFAYHRQNLRLLSVLNSTKARCFGTALGISSADCEYIEKDIEARLKIELTKIDLQRALRCAELLGSYGRALTT